MVQDQAARAQPRVTVPSSRPACGRAKCSKCGGERLDYLQVWDHKRERGGFIRAPSDAPRGPDRGQPKAQRCWPSCALCKTRRAPSMLGIGPHRRLPSKPHPPRLYVGMEGAQALMRAGHLCRPAGPPRLVAVPGKVRRCHRRHLDGPMANGACALPPTRLKAACRSATRARPAACWPCPWLMPSSASRAAPGVDPPRVHQPRPVAHERAKVTTPQADVERGRVQSAGLPAQPRANAPRQRAASRRLQQGVSKTERLMKTTGRFTTTPLAVVRWAALPQRPYLPAPVPHRPEPGAPGETCVLLVDAQHSAKAPRCCTYGVVWIGQHQPRRALPWPWRCSRMKAGANCGCCANRKAAGWPTCCPCHHAPDRRGRNGGLGARRPTNAGGPRSPGPGRNRALKWCGWRARPPNV